MRLSVILSTYESPSALRRTLAGYRRQTHRDFEVVVADDGSSPATADLLQASQQDFPGGLQHVWHEDRGFRKCRILNRAIVAARSDYLVFSDGDCVPWADFLAVHERLAHPSRFLSGGYFKLPQSTSEALTVAEIDRGRHEDLAWLYAHGLPSSWRSRRLGWRASGALLDAVTPTGATWNGHNASAWKRDLLAVNGFDERMGYGGEDRELGERLVHLGRRGLQIRHRALCLHLWHERGYVDDEILESNRELRRDTARRRRVRTPFGIDDESGAPAETV